MAKQRRNEPRKNFNLLEISRKGNSQFDFGEVYRHIRTNIEFSSVTGDIKTIAVTSSQPGEAKTTTALNLAIIFATKYKKVLLIDCDLRRSQLHKYLKLSNKAGLTNALVACSKSKVIEAEFFQKIRHESFVGPLAFLSSGSRVPNPAEILSSTTFKLFLQTLKQEYDFIILDCPPVLNVSDAIPIGNAADGTLFVCSSKDTKRKEAQNAVHTLQQNNVNILGTILTKADSYKSGYNYKYY